MKTFIFLLILIVAFFVYIFTADTKSNAQVPSSDNTPAVLTLEEVETSQTLPEQPQIEDVPMTDSTTPPTPKELFVEEEPPSIPEYMTFDRFEDILLEVNPHYPKSAITLNLPMNSIIRTKEEKQRFKEKVISTFHLSESEVENYMKENKIIWDWINKLR